MDDLAKLLAAFRKCDTLACRLEVGEAIITIIYTPIQAFIISRLGADRGEDVFQNTLSAITRSLPKTRGKSRSEFMGFCYKIARNQIADALRSQYAERADFMDPAIMAEIVEKGSEEEGLSPGDRLDLKYFMGMLRKSRFPCDEILWSYFVTGCAPKEIAEMYDVTYDAALRRISRCLDAVQGLAGET